MRPSSKPKQREALMTHRADALKSRELVTIRTDVPIDVDLETLRYRGASRERCYELFTRLAFRSLVNEYAPDCDDASRRTTRSCDRSTSSTRLVDALRAAGTFALRVIPSDPLAMRAVHRRHLAVHPSATGVSTCRSHNSAAGPAADLLTAASGPADADRAGGPRTPPASAGRPAIRKVGHDVKVDRCCSPDTASSSRGVEFDSMLASYLLDATRSSQRLEDVALEHVGYKALTEEAVRGRGAKTVPLSDVAPESLLIFAGERADLARQLSDDLSPLLAATHPRDGVSRARDAADSRARRHRTRGRPR